MNPEQSLLSPQPPQLASSVDPFWGNIQPTFRNRRESHRDGGARSHQSETLIQVRPCHLACSRFAPIRAYVTGYGQNDVSLSGDDPVKLFDRHETLGLAHFQQSGTGRIRSYYNYLLTTPYVGKGVEGVGKRYGLINEQASPGYYAGTLEESGIHFEATCSKRSAVHRYHFPKGKMGRVAIDFSSGGLLIEGMKTYPSQAEIELGEEGKARGSVTIEGITYFVEIEAFSPTAAQGFGKKSVA